MMQVYPLASNCDTEPRGFSELILVPIQRLLGTDHLQTDKCCLRHTNTAPGVRPKSDSCIDSAQ